MKFEYKTRIKNLVIKFLESLAKKITVKKYQSNKSFVNLLNKLLFIKFKILRNLNIVLETDAIFFSVNQLMHEMDSNGNMLVD